MTRVFLPVTTEPLAGARSHRNSRPSVLTRTDRDNRTQLVEPLTPRDHHLASAFLGLAIILLVVFAAYRAGQIEVTPRPGCFDGDCSGDAPRGER